jgi:hypothetical protein
LDFQLFKAKQEKVESISEWVQRVQTLGFKFRVAALMDCLENERAGILKLSRQNTKPLFVAGIMMILMT